MAGNFDYDRKIKRIQLSVGGKLAVFLLWREIFITTGKKRYITTGKKNTVVFLMGARFWRLRPEKKRYSRLSGGLCCCINFWFWREISIFFVVAGNFDSDRKKKDTVVCWREIGSFLVVAGNFHYDRKKKIALRPEKKKDTVVSGGKLAFFCSGGKF